MKHTLLTWSALTLFSAAFAQTPNTQLDPTFLYDPTDAGTFTFEFQEYGLNRVQALSDGKVMVVGSFREVFNNVTGIMRLNSDGSIDQSFDAPSANESIYIKGRSFVELSNGQYLLGGIFNSSPLGGTVTGLMRLNSDGTQDTGFGTEGIAFPTVQAIALQPDGKILIGGSFSGPDFGARVARLNADGTIDDSFSSTSLEWRDVRDLTLLPDGRILAAGNFTNWPTADGVHTTVGLALLNADGTPDTSFSHEAGTTFSTVVTAYPRAAVQPDGKIVVTCLSEVDSDIVKVVRYNADFSLDESFHIANNGEESGNYFTDVTVLSDGKILLSGYFINSYDGEPAAGILRLNPDGTIDTGFDPGIGFGNGSQVFDCSVQNDGKILLFTINNEYQGVELGPNDINPVRQLVVRLNGDVPPVLSAAEADEFTFEVYPNPANNFANINGLPRGAEIRIFDLQGRQVYQNITADENQVLNTGSFPAGLYILNIIDGPRSTARKLVVRR